MPHLYWFLIYGFNFAIVAGLFVGFFGWLLGRWRGMLAAFLGIALYAVLAGASAGVVRAAIMGGLGDSLLRSAPCCAQTAMDGLN